MHTVMSAAAPHRGEQHHPANVAKRLRTSCANLSLLEIVAGVVTGVLLSGFAVAYASAIFDEVGLDKFVELGVGMNYISIIITALVAIVFSSTPIMLNAPDPNPTIIFGDMAQICNDYMVLNNPVPGKPVDQTALASTILTVIMITTCFFGFILYILGRFRLTRVLQLLPTSILCGFMASIGYTIAYKALMLCLPMDVWNQGITSPDWGRLVAPALVMGVVMFIYSRWNAPATSSLTPTSVPSSSQVAPVSTSAFTMRLAKLRALHEKSRQTVGMPMVLFLPLLIFFITIYSTGGSVEGARADKWFIQSTAKPETMQIHFNSSAYGSGGLVSWGAVSACVPQMFLLFFVCSVDVMLRIAGIRKSLRAFDMQIDKEIRLAGMGNMLSGLLVGSPSYAQPALTQISATVGQTTTSSTPATIALILNSVMFLWGFPIVNYLPRFWLAGILFFSSFELLYANVWEARKHMSRKELLAVVIIVVVNALTSLAISVLTGVLLSGVIFAMAYGREGSIKSIHSGSSCRSGAVRTHEENAKLDRLGRKILVVRLHRFVFFGTAASINDFVLAFLKEQAEYERGGGGVGVRVFVFDWESVEDIDFSSLAVIAEIVANIYKAESLQAVNEGGERFLVVFTGVPPGVRAKFAYGDGEIMKLVHRGESWYSLGAQLSPSGLGGRGVEGDSRASREEEDEETLRMEAAALEAMVEARRQDEQVISIVMRSRSAHVDDARGLPKDRKRFFDSLDAGLEWVEDRLLERSAKEIRTRWLVPFDSFRRMHAVARAQAFNAATEHVLGVRLGQLVFPYVRKLLCKRGAVLLDAGQVSTDAFVVQRGRVNVYMLEGGGSVSIPASSTSFAPPPRRLVRSLRRGAFFNEDVLYGEDASPSVLCYEADAEGTIVLAMSREDAARFEEEKPLAAVEFHKKIAKYVSTTRSESKRLVIDYASRIKSLSASSFSSRRPFETDGDDEGDGDVVIAHAGPRAACRRGLNRCIVRSNPIRRRKGSVSVMDELFSAANLVNLSLGTVTARSIFYWDSTASSSAGEILNNNTKEVVTNASGGVSPTPTGTPPPPPHSEEAERLKSSAALGRYGSRQRALEEKFLPLSDPRLEHDWMKVARGAKIARVEDIVRAFGVSKAIAEEMVWECDAEGKRGVTLVEVLDAVCSVYAGVEFAAEIEVLKDEDEEAAANATIGET